MQAPRRGNATRFAMRAGGSLLSEGDTQLAMMDAAVELSILDRNFAYQSSAYPLGGSSGGFGFSLDASLGVMREENETGGFRDSVGIDWALVPYAQASVPVSERIELFARAGYGAARFDFELEGPGVAIDDSSTEWFFGFGAGAQIFLDRRNGVRVGYTRWDDFESGGISANLFSIAYVRVLGQRP